MVVIIPRLRRIGLSTCPQYFKKGEVLHVSGADLQDVHVFIHQVGVHGIDDFRDYRQLVRFTRLGEKAQAVLFQTLETVG